MGFTSIVFTDDDIERGMVFPMQRLLENRKIFDLERRDEGHKLNGPWLTVW